MNLTGIDLTPSAGPVNRRGSERRAVAMPARLTWKDQRGATRFASVIVRDVSEHGVYLESHSVVSIPLFRLVQFQLERDAREPEVPVEALRHGRVLSAVYRISPPRPDGKPQGLALRLLAEPKRRIPERSDDARATA